MKVYLKNAMSLGNGVVLDVYVTDSGQKRMNVSFAYGKVDADAREFELV